jgi:hypothetical protein
MNIKGVSRDFVLVITLILSLSILGCSTKTPSEEDARKVFENKWAWHIKMGKIEIISFKKVKARTEDRVGIKFYTIEYEAQLKASNLNFSDWQRLRLDGIFEKQRDIEGGEILKLWGEISFVKTEDGWKGEDGVLY